MNQTLVLLALFSSLTLNAYFLLRPEPEALDVSAAHVSSAARNVATAKERTPQEDLLKVSESSPSASRTTASDEKLERSAADKLSEKKSDHIAYRVSRRIKTVEKFFPLTKDQRERLAAHEQARLSKQKPEESLADIIGAENAVFFDELKEKSMARAKREAVDRELFYLARRFRLLPAQEARLELILEELDDLTRSALQEEGLSKAEPRYWVSFTAKRREVLRNELEPVMSPEQYEEYLRYDEQSSSADTELWH